MGGPPGGGPIPARYPDDAWQEFSAPDGRKYYYNSITQENTWEKPKALIDKESKRVSRLYFGLSCLVLKHC